MSTPERRKIILIDKRFQLRMIGRFVAVQALILTMFGGLIYLFLDSELGAGLSSAHVTFRNMREMIFPIVLTLSLVNFLVSAIVITGFVLYASHRIAGPLFRFKSVIDSMARRTLPVEGSLRDGDQLAELLTSLKGLSELLRSDLREIQSELDTLEEAGQQGLIAREQMEPVDKIRALIGSYRF